MQRALLWHDGKLQADVSTQSIQNALQDPTVVLWLDLTIDHDPEKYMSTLHDLLKFLHLTLESIGELIPTEVEPYFAEVYDHLIRTFEVLDSYRDLMSGLLDVYLTTVSNRLHQVMKQLTIIATIFMPITFITGVFGQNFLHTPQVETDRGFNFWIVLAIMAIITLAQIWYFKFRNWL